MFKKKGGRNLRQKQQESGSDDDEVKILDPVEPKRKDTKITKTTSETKLEAPAKPPTVSSLLSFGDEEGDSCEGLLLKKKEKTKKSRPSKNLRNADVQSVEFSIQQEDSNSMDAHPDLDILIESESNVGGFGNVKSVGLAGLRTEIHNGIPDSNLIHQIRKKREMARKQQSGAADFVPLREEPVGYKKSTTSERSRLVREDENDMSDPEEEMGGGAKFFSSKGTKNEMNRRLAEANFLSIEQGDSDADDQDAFDNWEKEQLKKAVSSHQLLSYQNEQNQLNVFHSLQSELVRHTTGGTARFSGKSVQYMNDPTSMDIVHVDENDIPSFNQTSVYPKLGGGEEFKEEMPVSRQQTLEDIRSCLSQRLTERKDVLRSLNAECDQVQDRMIANLSNITKLEEEVPKVFQSYQFLQEMQSFTRDLIDCLDDKLPEIEALEHQLIELLQSRRDNLTMRRIKDVEDQYDECQTASTGRKLDESEERSFRLADREARRTRRRLAREKTVGGLGHQEGMSSDDDEPPSQTVLFNAEREKILNTAEEIFSDVAEEYCSAASVCSKLAEWHRKYPETFNTAYIALYLPKLLGPIVRLQLILFWSPCEATSQNFHVMDWFRSLILFGSGPEHVDQVYAQVDESLADFVPQIFEKVVCPRLTEYVEKVWDPVSSTETERLTQLIRSIIRDFPTIGGTSKHVQSILNSVVSVIKKCLGESVFMPLFSRSAMEKKSTGAAVFFERQFWFCFKLMRNVLMWEDILSTPCLLQLALDGLLNRYVVLGLQCGSFTDVATLVKVKAITGLIKPQWLSGKSREMTLKQLEPLGKIICRISEEISASGETPIAKDSVLELHKCLRQIGAQQLIQ